MPYKTMSPAELSEKIKNGEKVRLIDVREPEEFALARIADAELLPLSEFQSWSGKLNPDEEIVFMCHHGVRSANVCNYLAQSGFQNLWNLSGGIDAWTLEVDRTVPRY